MTTSRTSHHLPLQPFHSRAREFSALQNAANLTFFLEPSSKRIPIRHTLCNAENISKLSATVSKTKSENTRLLQLEHGLNDVLRQLSNMQNQMKAMKLKVQRRDERKED
ncbi:hypothetical protein ACHAWO_003320 [Cyclotella atomus]|uniref:Uncharacterized protein n=1 Tax=Cyclotella atomus TaxID=382360 RepID=A0ABD3N4H5_9STRA